MHSEKSLLIGLFALFSSLWAIVIILLVYGTLAKRRWGISLRRAACPRCGTPDPLVRQPTSRWQTFLSGWTCEACGLGVDKWGREMALVGLPPRTAYRTEAEVRSALRKRTLVRALVALPVGMLLEFYVKGGGLPTSWAEVVIGGCDTLVTVGLITATFYFLAERQLIRRFRENRPQGSAHSR